MTLAYDGTGFHGWQRQPGLRTVQGELERALAGALGEAPVAVHGAGRTDAGVHARGQVASFVTGSDLPARAIAVLAARHLPADVRIVRVEDAPAGFHARHSARSRRYTYRLLAAPDLLLERLAWHPRRAWDPEGAARAVTPLPGVHDCSAFEAAGSSPADPVCRITLARWTRWEGGVQFEVEADHFLYHMVRNLVGTAVGLSRERDPAACLREVLESRARSRAGATAPARGLCLESVRYADQEEAA